MLCVTVALLIDRLMAGRILNRFSKDVSFLDDYLPGTFFDFLQVSCRCIACCMCVVTCGFQGAFAVIGVVFFVSIINPWIFLITAPLTVVFYFIRIVFGMCRRYNAA